MIECIFTLDYEIYGNGEGSLDKLIYEPMEKLLPIFNKYDAKIVLFVESAELHAIESVNSDPAIVIVKEQINRYYGLGHEIALHLHPQWYNATFIDSQWKLDYSEYNLCTLPKERICQIIEIGIEWLQKTLRDSDFKPASFRAGNWLFQPTQTIAHVLVEKGITIDSSVFKGGLQHYYKLDYRKSKNNGYYWKFHNDVNIPDPNGKMFEIPIYTKMVPLWKLATGKRIGLHKKAATGAINYKMKINRILDRARLLQPLKFDFCKMSLNELTTMMDSVIKDDKIDNISYKPIVLIGHSKDLIDFKTVESFLSYLNNKNIAISTLKDVRNKCV